MKIIITAGPTREHIDPVRFISNPSTGKMGFALASAAARRNHEVVLVSGPVALKTPRGVRRIDVVSAREMLKAVEEEISFRSSDDEKIVFISVAAVADWRPKTFSPVKMKKSAMTGTLELVRNPDILKSLNKKRLARLKLVGFAAETGDPVDEAVRKCREKGLSFIVANDVSLKGAGFGSDTNLVSIIARDGSQENLPMMSKLAVAKRIILKVERL